MNVRNYSRNVLQMSDLLVLAQYGTIKKEAHYPKWNLHEWMEIVMNIKRHFFVKILLLLKSEQI